jgi:hypothetical protein
MLLLHDWLLEAELYYLMVSARIANYIINFTIIIELVKWIYWIVHKFFEWHTLS